MLALYRGGRQAEALDVYRETRNTLNGSLGVEPTRALSELQRAILQHDPSLELPAVPKKSFVISRRRRVLAALVVAACATTAAALAFVLSDRDSAPR